MGKTIIFGEKARDGLKKGVDILSDAVKITLGPRGLNVGLQRQFGSAHVTKDGVTVAKEIELSDPLQNMGAMLVKEVASKTADDAGDGTTTATVLAQAIITEGFKNVAAGANPMDLKRGIDKAVSVVTDFLKSASKPVKDNDTIKQIASISANNDEFIGGLIASAMAKVGNEGLISVEESQDAETSIVVVEGMQFDRGYKSPYFVTNTERMVAEYEKPLILIYDKKISSMLTIVPVLEVAQKSGGALIIICEDMDSEALATMVLNRVQSRFPVAVVKSPGFGDNRMDMLEDMAILTGGQVFSEDQGRTLTGILYETPENVADSIKLMGKCTKILIGNDSTTIIGGLGDVDAIKLRVNNLKMQLENAKSDREKQNLTSRIAKLSGGVAIVKVGAASETEMKQKKDRVDDALHATKAAIAEGVLPGGGVAYIRAIEQLKGLKGATNDENTGISIIAKALESPFRQIVTNAGQESSIILQKVRDNEDVNFGYNSRSEVFEDLIKSGVIDPAKVARVALENAASVSGMLLTMPCVVLEEVGVQDNQPKMPGMGGY